MKLNFISLLFVIGFSGVASSQNWIYTAGNRVSSEVIIFSEELNGFFYMYLSQFGGSSMGILYPKECDSLLMLETNNAISLKYSINYKEGIKDDFTIFINESEIVVFDIENTLTNTFGVSIMSDSNKYYVNIPHLSNKDIIVEKMDGHRTELYVIAHNINYKHFYLLNNFNLALTQTSLQEFKINPEIALKEYFKNYESHNFQTFNNFRNLKKHLGKSVIKRINKVQKVITEHI
jgi:hypothetical protein